MDKNRTDVMEVVKGTMQKLDRLEQRNGGPINANIDKQLRAVVMELGKLNENLLKAEATKDEKAYSDYWVGIRTAITTLAARTISLGGYINRNFDDQGKPIQRS